MWLVQRGSPESKRPGQEGREPDPEQQIGAYEQPGSPKWARRGGVRTLVYSNSLLLVMATIWLQHVHRVEG